MKGSLKPFRFPPMNLKIGLQGAQVGRAGESIFG